MGSDPVPGQATQSDGPSDTAHAFKTQSPGCALDSGDRHILWIAAEADRARGAMRPARCLVVPDIIRAAFDRRCIPPRGARLRPIPMSPGFGEVSPEPWRRRIARRSNTPGAGYPLDSGDPDILWIAAEAHRACGAMRPARCVRPKNAPQARRTAAALFRHGRSGSPGRPTDWALPCGQPEPKRASSGHRRRCIFPRVGRGAAGPMWLRRHHNTSGLPESSGYPALPVFALLAPCAAGASPVSVPRRNYARDHSGRKMRRRRADRGGCRMRLSDR